VKAAPFIEREVRCLGLAPAGDSGVTTNYLPNYARAFDSSSRLEKLAIVVDHSMDADGHPQSAYCRGAQYKYARFGIPAVAFSTGTHADYRQATDEPPTTSTWLTSRSSCTPRPGRSRT